MIHVCFCFHDKTGRYAKFTGTAMLSLFENQNTPPPVPSITVHILHDNTLTKENRDKFIYLADQYNQLVKFYNIEELCADRISKMLTLIPLAKTSRLSVAALYRLLSPQLISEEIEKIIYLDSDIVVNLDINELWQIDLADKIFAAVPEISNGVDTQKILPLCYEGYVSKEDYFNSGVLLMNLKHLRDKEEVIEHGIKVIGNNPKYDLLDQDILNYLFSKDYMKLPVKFNLLLKKYRRFYKASDSHGIFHYTDSASGVGLTLDQNDPFNRLWMDYFMKTPWFDKETIKRLCSGFHEILVKLNAVMIKLSVMLSGKMRKFIITKENVQVIKMMLSIQENEEIIIVDKYLPLQEIFEKMSASRGKAAFFIFVPDFPIVNFLKLGFVYGEDFVNGFAFLQNVPNNLFNSYPPLQTM